MDARTGGVVRAAAGKVTALDGVPVVREYKEREGQVRSRAGNRGEGRASSASGTLVRLELLQLWRASTVLLALGCASSLAVWLA